MNYLAHAFLASDDPVDLLGQTLGDLVKGSLPGELDPEMADAIAAHRAVDRRCDQHSEFAATRRRFFDEFSHYAGVITDVVYDHVLASEWDRFAAEPLEHLAHRVYDAIDLHADRLPDRAAEIAHRMSEARFLERYATLDELEVALERFGRRLRRPAQLENAVATVARHRSAITAEFAAVLADLESRPGPRRAR